MKIIFTLLLCISKMSWAGIHVQPEFNFNNQKVSPKTATYSTLKDINIDLPKGWFVYNENGSIVSYFEKITKKNLIKALRCELKNYKGVKTLQDFKNRVEKLRRNPKFSKLYIDLNYKFEKKWVLIYYSLKGKKGQRLELRRYIDSNRTLVGTVIANDYDDNFEEVKKALLSCRLN